MDASSVFLHQKLTSEGLSGTVITTKTLPTKASPTCLNVEPRRKWEFYLVNSIRTEHYSTAITILRVTMLLIDFSGCFYLLMEKVGRVTRWPQPPMVAHHQWFAGNGTRLAPFHLKSPLNHTSTDFYPVKKSNTTTCIFLCQRKISYINQLVSFFGHHWRNSWKNLTCYRTNTTHSKNGFDFCLSKKNARDACTD